jgi:hypothetical protein
MSDAEPVTLKWTTTTVTEFPKTGIVKAGSMRISRSATAPPCVKEEGTPVQRFEGEPTRIFVFQAESADTWHVDHGFNTRPRQLAEYLIGAGRAFLARPAEPLPIGAATDD